MAHVYKVKSSGVANMIAHYERTPELQRGYRRDNINPAKTAENFNLRPQDALDKVRAAIADHVVTTGKALRKDANVLLDWVVTKPADCPIVESVEFFEATTKFMEARYGKDRILGAYVHMDETTPHVHIPLLPVVDGKLNASAVVNRADLRTLHRDLGKFVDEYLGFHVSIELSPEQTVAKALSAVPHDKLAEVTKELDDRIAERTARLEYLQREIERVEAQEPAGHSLGKSIGDVRASVEGRKREQEVATKNQLLRERIAELERDRETAIARIRSVRDGIERLRGVVSDVRRSLTKAVKKRCGYVAARLQIAASRPEDIPSLSRALTSLGFGGAKVFETGPSLALERARIMAEGSRGLASASRRAADIAHEGRRSRGR